MCFIRPLIVSFKTCSCLKSGDSEAKPRLPDAPGSPALCVGTLVFEPLLSSPRPSCPRRGPGWRAQGAVSGSFPSFKGEASSGKGIRAARAAGRGRPQGHGRSARNSSSARTPGRGQGAPQLLPQDAGLSREEPDSPAAPRSGPGSPDPGVTSRASPRGHW